MNENQISLKVTLPFAIHTFLHNLHSLPDISPNDGAGSEGRQKRTEADCLLSSVVSIQLFPKFHCFETCELYRNYTNPA